MAAKVTIYTKLGVPRVDAYDYVYSGEFMGERKVAVEVKSPVEIEFAVGDYIVLERESEVFTLQSIPVGNRVYNSLMITYNLEFWWRGYELKTINFLDYVDGTENESAYNRNTGEVIVAGTVVQLMDRIIANMNRAYSDGWYGSWNYLIDESVDTTIIKDIELQNAKCWDAVLLINSLFELNFRLEFSDRVILVGYPPEVSTHTFEFGKGKGLCDITRLQPETALVTRVYAYGSTQNIPSDYRTGQYTNGYMPRLMLPQATYPNGYMANAELEAAYGIREDYFIDDTIFPTIPDTMNTIDEVLPIYDAPDVDDEPPAIDSKPLTLKPFHTWYYDEFGNRVYNPQTAYDDDVTEIKYSLPTSFVSGNGMSYNEATVFIVTDLDINAPEVKGSLPAQMSFKTGQLQGTTLQINSWTREYVDGFPTDRMKVVLQRETSDIGYQLPNATVKMVAGDEFVLLNINLPNAYILDAENRLETATQEWMAANIGEPLAYNIVVPEEFVARTPGIYYYLREGCGIPLFDTILNVDATYLVQNLTITYRSEKILPEYNLTISNKPIKSRVAQLEAELKSTQQTVAAADMRIEQNNISNLKSAFTFKQSITNNYGELLGSLIEPQSIIPTALGTDLRSARYLLQAYLQINYGGDINTVYGSDGLLIHKDTDIVWGNVFDLAHQTWTIATPQTFTALDPLKYYWAYIKGSLTDGSATWYLSETKLLADEVAGYYMFEWGQIMPVREGTRIVQATYGATYVLHNPVTIAEGSSSNLSIDENQVLSFIGGGGSSSYNWKLNSPEQVTGYLLVPSGITVDVDGTGSVVESVAAGQLNVTAINAQGETTPADVPAFDVLADSTEALVSWTPVSGAIGYRVYDTISGNYKEITGEGFDYLTFVFDTAGTPPAENTAAILQTAFTIANNDTVEFTGENVTVETSVDPEDSTKKRVHLVVTGTGADVIAGDGMDFADNDPVTLGLPSTIDSTTENAVTETSHTHKLGVISAENIEVIVPDDYPLLYNFYVVSDARNIAPIGWHVPTNDDWEYLKTYLGGDSVAAGKLKEIGLKHWNYPNTGATNEVGFNSIGAGYRFNNGSFGGIRSSVYYWSSYNSSDATRRYGISSNDTTVLECISTELSSLDDKLIQKEYGICIRFVKDDSTDPGTMTDNDGFEYSTVKIGDLVWTAQDHRGVMFRNSDEIPFISNADAWADGDTIPKCCSYADNAQNIIDNSHLPVTIHPDSAAFASIDENQVLTIEEQAGGGGVTQITGLTILASGWVADGSLYKYELSNAAITADHICEIVPDDAAYDILVAAKPLAKTTSVAGTVTMKVHAIPSGDFTVTLNLYTKTA